MQVPSHVQNTINKDERLLQRKLGDLERETKHRMRCIVQDQQVAAIKLRTLQARLAASQKRSMTFLSARQQCDRRKSSTDPGSFKYFKSLMAPGLRESFSAMLTQDDEEEKPEASTSEGGRGEETGAGPAKRQIKSSLKKAARVELEEHDIDDPELKRKNVTFTAY